jgi:hypothetical protein
LTGRFQSAGDELLGNVLPMTLPESRGTQLEGLDGKGLTRAGSQWRWTQADEDDQWWRRQLVVGGEDQVKEGQ